MPLSSERLLLAISVALFLFPFVTTATAAGDALDVFESELFGEPTSIPTAASSTSSIRKTATTLSSLTLVAKSTEASSTSSVQTTPTTTAAVVASKSGSARSSNITIQATKPELSSTTQRLTFTTNRATIMRTSPPTLTSASTASMTETTAATTTATIRTTTTTTTTASTASTQPKRRSKYQPTATITSQPSQRQSVLIDESKIERISVEQRQAEMAMAGYASEPILFTWLMALLLMFISTVAWIWFCCIQ